MSATLRKLKVEGLRCGHGGRTVLAGVSFTLAGGEVLGLLGPNGCGKTTLFKTLLRLLPAQGGRVLLDGEDVGEWSRRRFACHVGYVPQAHIPPFPFTVRDVVAMGRTAHLGFLGRPTKHDLRIADKALDDLAIVHLRHRSCTEISGGERQLMLLARALAQQPDILVLDEPTSALDFGNQIRVLEHVTRLAAATGIGVIMTTHDPNHALTHCTRVATIDPAGGFAVGPPAAMVTEAYLRRTYGLDARIVEVDDRGEAHKVCLPLSGSAGEAAA